MAHLNELKLLYQQLKRQKQELDVENNISEQIFVSIEETIRDEEINTENKAMALTALQTKLTQLSQYLSNYSFFNMLTNKREVLKQNFPQELLEKSYNFRAAENYISQITQYFKEGQFLKTGLVTTCAQLNTYLDNCPKEMRQLQQIVHPAQHPLQLTGFSKYYQQQATKSMVGLQAFIAKEINTNTNIPIKWLQAIEKGFTNLRLKSMQHRAEGKPFTLNKPIKKLKKALQNFDDDALLKAIAEFKEQVPQSKIVSHQNNSRILDKRIDLKGRSAENSMVLVRLNNQKKWEVPTNKKGVFVVPDIELKFGENLIEFENKDFGFLEAAPQIFRIQLEKKYLFLGRIDPLTQMEFSVSQIKDIMRCADCYNFCYNFSVEENEGRCAMPKCDGKTFFNANDTDFWLEG